MDSLLITENENEVKLVICPKLSVSVGRRRTVKQCQECHYFHNVIFKGRYKELREYVICLSMHNLGEKGNPRGIPMQYQEIGL